MVTRSGPYTVGWKRVSVASLHEDPANARKHGARNRATVRASLSEFGQVEALVVEAGTGRVIGGNCRLAVLREMGVEEVEVVEVDVHGTDATRLGLALNRTAELAEWDAESLSALLADLDDSALESLAFDNLDGLLGALDTDSLDAGGHLGGETKGESPRKQTVSLVVFVADVADIETAIQRALENGCATRGDALALICREWRDGAR